MKKILFVLPNADIGGTRTSFINLAPQLDRTQLDISLLFMCSGGVLTDRAKAVVNVLPPDGTLDAVMTPRSRLLKNGCIGAIIRGAMLRIMAKLHHKSAFDYACEQAAKHYSGRYDCVVAYQENYAARLCTHIVAPKRIAWIHAVCEGVKGDRSTDYIRRLYDSFDRVVFVSDACRDGFCSEIGFDRSKTERIYNTFKSQEILAKSKEYTVDRSGRLTLVSAGRFVKEKRYDRIVSAAARLRSDGFDFCWYIIGDGQLFDIIRNAVDAAGLGDNVVLTGRMLNPYPYFAAADAVIVSSIIEAHPMIANESLIIGTPVIATGFPAASEIVQDGKTGIVCANSEEGLYNAIKRLLTDGGLLPQLKENVKQFTYDNASIIRQIESLLD